MMSFQLVFLPLKQTKKTLATAGNYEQHTIYRLANR